MNGDVMINNRVHSSLPYRQLMNMYGLQFGGGVGSLPYRQLMNLSTSTQGDSMRSLPYRQLMKPQYAESRFS